jgi:CRISPR system Cascade subunit CasE
MDVRNQPGGVLQGRKPGRGRGTRLTFEGALFEGNLEVVDSNLFFQTLSRGIGAGKAYGFGLLSIRRA